MRDGGCLVFKSKLGAAQDLGDFVDSEVGVERPAVALDGGQKRSERLVEAPRTGQLAPAGGWVGGEHLGKVFGAASRGSRPRTKAIYKGTPGGYHKRRTSRTPCASYEHGVTAVG